jgi:hypothetical protein
MTSWIIVSERGRNAWYKEVTKRMNEGYILHPESFSVNTRTNLSWYNVLMSIG